MKPITLPANHYAANWKYEDFVPRPAREITELGRIYAELPDEVAGRSNPQKQEKLLELCQEFHPYLIKYLVMINQGHVPVWGNGQTRNAINSDIKKFIRYFLPKGAPCNKAAISRAVRHLHLAFKGMETEEIYDVLMQQFLKAVKKYDPHYTEKAKRVVKTIHETFTKTFTAAAVDDYLEFGSDRYLRMLCRRGFLAPVYYASKEKRIAGFQRSGSWPPPAGLFENGAIGLAYYIQTWFRYCGCLEGRRSSLPVKYSSGSDGKRPWSTIILIGWRKGYGGFGERFKIVGRRLCQFI